MYGIFWGKLQELNVPLYIQPQEPIPQAQLSYEGFEFLAGSTLGFSIETMTHVLRIMLAVTFDRYPQAKVVIGHCGEGLPLFMERMKQRMRYVDLALHIA